MTTPSHVAVVVPARDEEQLLPRCLTAVAAAVAELGTVMPEVRARVFVVLDSCTDDTAGVIADHDVTACVTQAGRVGTARAIGVAAAAAWAGPAAQLWIANTDADSVVPPHWLRVQLELAKEGIDMVVGTVEPGLEGTTRQAHQEWLSRHTLADGHEHVHGANLGFSIQTYREVGGFQHVSIHEDALLVEAIRAAGRTWVATDAIRVLTSSRRVSRVTGGFASYLEKIEGTTPEKLVTTPIPRGGEARAPSR